VSWQRRVEQGYPAEVIVSLASDEAVDLIVIGNRGMSGVGRFLVGSVSDRVVHHAPCSVLVVK
jgi:nucleotide-binding universal stress UspA family protein